MKLNTLVQLSVAGILATASANANIFSENFNAITAGTAITHSNTNYTDSFNGAGTSQTATADTGGIFGEGTSNIYNRTIDTSSSESARINANNLGGGDVATYSWDFNDSSTAGGYAFRLSTANDAQSNFSVQVNFRPGTGNYSIIDNDNTADYSPNITYRIDVVANTGASTINFLDGYGASRSVDADSFSIFLTDIAAQTQTVVKDNIAFNGTETGPGFDSIAFQTFNGSNGIDVAWDNVVVQDIASVTAVPEPSTYAIYAGLAVLGLVVYRRRRRGAL